MLRVSADGIPPGVRLQTSGCDGVGEEAAQAALYEGGRVVNTVGLGVFTALVVV